MASGKDAAAAYIAEHYGGIRVAFADEVKATAQRLFNVDPSVKDDRTRGILQDVGMKMREIDADVWLGVIVRTVAENERCGSDSLLTDVRFWNEAQFAQKCGVLVRINADVDVRERRLRAAGHAYSSERASHVSETALDFYVADYTIDNNGSYAEFTAELDLLMEAIAR